MRRYGSVFLNVRGWSSRLPDLVTPHAFCPGNTTSGDTDTRDTSS
jgi:hypothetical protein